MQPPNDPNATSANPRKWIPLESNAEVFTKYAHELGFPEMFSFVDVFSLDPEMWAYIPQPVLSLILLYEIKDEHKEVIYQQID